MQRRPVLRNIAILMAAGFLERILGALYRVLLARRAGSVALGLIQFCMPILRLGYILGTLGLPQTLIRVVAEAHAAKDPDTARRAMSYASRITLMAGGGLSLLLFFAAPLGHFVFPDPRMVTLLRWLAPILICDCLQLIIQANYQGENRMWPVAMAGVLGQSVKLIITLCLLNKAVVSEPGSSARVALAAVAVSEVMALGLLVALRGKNHVRHTCKGDYDPKKLILASLPLMGDGLVFAVAGALDMMIIPRRLVGIGLAAGDVTAMMGQAWGMALPTIFLPMMIIWPITAATLPVLAAAAARKDGTELRRRISLTYLAVTGVSALTTLLMLTAARPLVTILYACPAAAPYLRLFAWAVVPIYLASIGGTFLIALGQSALVFRQSLACATVRTALLFVLTGLPHLGLKGAIIAIIAGNTLLALANGLSILRLLWSTKTAASNAHAALLAPRQMQRGASAAPRGHAH